MSANRDQLDREVEEARDRLKAVLRLYHGSQAQAVVEAIEAFITELIRAHK